MKKYVLLITASSLFCISSVNTAAKKTIPTNMSKKEEDELRKAVINYKKGRDIGSATNIIDKYNRKYPNDQLVRAKQNELMRFDGSSSKTSEKIDKSKPAKPIQNIAKPVKPNQNKPKPTKPMQETSTSVKQVKPNENELQSAKPIQKTSTQDISTSVKPTQQSAQDPMALFKNTMQQIIDNSGMLLGSNYMYIYDYPTTSPEKRLQEGFYIGHAYHGAQWVPEDPTRDGRYNRIAIGTIGFEGQEAAIRTPQFYFSYKGLAQTIAEMVLKKIVDELQIKSNRPLSNESIKALKEHLEEIIYDAFD